VASAQPAPPQLQPQPQPLPLPGKEYWRKCDAAEVRSDGPHSFDGLLAILRYRSCRNSFGIAPIVVPLPGVRLIRPPYGAAANVNSLPQSSVSPGLAAWPFVCPCR
jgi:hypothetical protein